MDEQQRMQIYKDADAIRRLNVFRFEPYIFAIAVLQGKRKTLSLLGGDGHPLEILFLYSYSIDKAIEVLSGGDDIIGKQLKYYKEIKQALDTQGSEIIAEKYSPDDVNKLLLGFIEERVSDYDYRVKNIYPRTPNDGYYFGNLFSQRSFLEGLLQRCKVMRNDVSDILSQISELDVILKLDADVSWIGEDTEATRVINFTPSGEWWWCKENYW